MTATNIEQSSEQPSWLGNDDLARRFRVSIDTIRKWRYEGTGPRGVRFGRHVRYPIDEVERWEQEQIAHAK